eukprot:scaffold2950_cov128-Pinguiococcus_pyrenoidosus.AAC.1
MTKPRKERERDPADPSRRQARHWSRSSFQIHSKQDSQFIQAGAPDRSRLRQSFRAFSANGVVGKVELSELRHARQSSFRQGFGAFSANGVVGKGSRAFSANGVAGKVKQSELRHARQSSLRQGFRAFSANGVVGKVERRLVALIGASHRPPPPRLFSILFRPVWSFTRAHRVLSGLEV